MNHVRHFLATLMAAICAVMVSAQTTEHVDSLNINVTIPGTLGDLILAQTENFSDLKVLKISGEISYSDMDNIQRCTNLRKIDMKGVTNTSLRNELFKESKIVDFILPDCLEVINSNMFTDCDRMKRIILPPNLINIAYQGFYCCDSLEYVECPQSLEIIETYAFAYCYKLRQVILREGLKTIGEHVFRNTDLEEISFPNSVKSIGYAACYQCNNLKRATLPQGIITISATLFEGCTSLQEIDIPASVETINSSAFRNCTNLETVHLQEGLRSLDGYIFESCYNLRNISLPSTLVEIGSNCFDGCQFPTAFDIYCIVPPQYSGSKKPFPCETIRVPSVSIVDYKQRSGWDQFNILPLPELPDIINICDNNVKINLPELPADYKPSMTVEFWKGNNSFSVEVNGSQTLSLSDYKQEHIFYLSGYDAVDNHINTSLIANVPMRADRVQITHKGNHLTYQYSSPNRPFWKFITLPFNAKMQNVTLVSSDGVPPTFLIYEYSGAKRALGETGSTWQRLSDDATMQAGKGYILGANCDVTFYAIDDSEKNNIFRTNDVEVALEEHLAEFAHNRSWNLTGNPFPCWYDSRMMEFDAPFVVWKNCNYATFTPYDDSYVFRPGEAFFVQRPVDSGTIVFPVEGRQNSSAVVDRSAGTNSRRMLPSDRRVYNLTLTGGGMEDRTRICINPQATTDYDISRDASKFMSLDGSAPQLYSHHNEVKYSINERPEADGMVSLGMKLPQSGTYTISLSTTANQPITLIDKSTGKSTLMNDGISHTFDATETNIEERFVIALGDYTSITELENANQNDTPIIYDLQGRRLNTTSLKKGIYVVNGKKMVIGQ